MSGPRLGGTKSRSTARWIVSVGFVAAIVGDCLLACGGFTTAPCTPSGREQCNDGVDNDCNGRIDCADEACGDFACVPAPPSGWAFLAFAAEQEAGVCPPHYGQDAAPVATEESLGDGGCLCTCSGTACIATLKDFATEGCQSSETSSQLALVSGVCAPMDEYQMVPGHGYGWDLSRKCSPGTAMPAPLQAAGLACASEPLGKGCDRGAACAARTAAPFASCISHAGDVPCPALFPGRSVVGATRNPSSCPTSCSCQPDPADATCDPAVPVELVLSEDSTCATPIPFQRPNETRKQFYPGPSSQAACEIAPDGSTAYAHAYRWDYPDVPTCAPVASEAPASSADGGLFADASTICCVARDGGR